VQVGAAADRAFHKAHGEDVSASGYAQDYVVNGHNASKVEAQFLASYSAPAGHWQADGYGISRVADEHPAPPAGRKCWYVLDVQLCD
jgi:hypothetical protein